MCTRVFGRTGFAVRLALISWMMHAAAAAPVIAGPQLVGGNVGPCDPTTFCSYAGNDKKFCVIEIPTNELNDPGESCESVYGRAEDLHPPFIADRTYLPVLMKESPFNSMLNLPTGRDSWVVRGCLDLQAQDLAGLQLLFAGGKTPSCDELDDALNTILGGPAHPMPPPAQGAQAPTPLAVLSLPQSQGGLIFGFLNMKALCTQGSGFASPDVFVHAPEPANPSDPGSGVCGLYEPPFCPLGSCPAPFGQCALFPYYDPVFVYDRISMSFVPTVTEHPCSDALASIAELRQSFRLDVINGMGFRGEGMTIGIVDGGVHKDDLRAFLNAYDATLPAPLFDLGTDDVVIGGWPTGAVCSGTAPPLYGTKSDWAEHGNMTATDALLASPGARILDIRISSPNCCDFCFSAGCGVLSNALAGYAWAIDVGKPDVLSNSWGVFRLTDAMDYASQPSHWFNRKVDEALAAGIAVLFAAGNTGEDAVFCPPCPVPAAPGTSPCQDTNAPFPTPIFGANGKPEVITVGGVSAKLGDFVSYSTPGPALLADVNQPVLSLKPDLLAPTHYNGYWGGVRPFLSGLPFLTADAGTSAACPIAAGVVALIREAAPTAGQDQIKACLKITASPLGTPDPSFVDLPWGGHNRYEGAGAIAPLAAFMKATADCNQNQISDIEDVAAGTSNDFDQNAVPDECDPLSVDTPTVPVTGGAQKLTLNGGAPWSGFFYILFFGFKGTFPGLPIGTKTLPLNQPNLLTFGSLGPMGDATVTFFVPPGLDSSLIGVKIHNAYAVATPGPIEVSNATPLAITAP